MLKNKILNSIIYCITIIIIYSFTFINQIELDSVKYSAEKKIIDSLLNEYQFQNSSVDDSIIERLNSLNLYSHLIKYNKGIAETNYLMGYFYDIKSIGDSAIKYYNKGLEYSKALDYDSYIGTYGEYIAETYWETGQYFECIDFTKKMIDYYLSANETDRLFYLYDVLALSYRDIGDLDAALDNFHKSYQNSIQNNEKAFTATTLTNIGKCYFLKEDYKTALEYYLKGVEDEVKYGHKAYAGRSYVTMACIYLKFNQVTEAEHYLQMALKYNHESDDIIGFSRTYKALGELYLYKRNYKKSIKYLKKSEYLSLQGGKNLTTADIYKDLSFAYKKINQADSSLCYLEKYLTISEKIITPKKITDLKKYEYDLKVEKNAHKLKQLELDKQKTRTKLLAIIFMLALIVSILFVSLYIISVKSRKRLEKVHKELKQAHIKAEESSKLKSEFLKNISHEIRTPLNGITGFLKFLTDDACTAENRKLFVSSIQESSDNLIYSIENIVEIAHISSNQIDIRKTKIDINDIIMNKLNSYQEKAEAKNIKLVINNNIDKDFILYTDSRMIAKTLNHLIDNAIKFTEQGEITISQTLENDQLIVCIADSGIGISNEIREKIYNLFEKGLTNYNKLYGGLGLGLTISKQLIEKLGGKLWFTTRLNHGTSFYFSIPLNN